MLKSLKAWTALAVLAIVVAVGSLFVLRHLRTAAVLPDPNAAPTMEVSTTGSSPTDSTTSDSPPVEAAVPATPSPPPAPEPVKTAVAPDPGNVFRDKRFDELLSSEQTATQPPRPAPEVVAPVVVKPAGGTPRMFEDTRSVEVDRPAERPVPPGSASREAGLSVRPRPAEIPSPFVDQRIPATTPPPATPPRISGGERASTEIRSSRLEERASPVASEPQATSPPQGFFDSRELVQPSARPPAISERREFVQRSAQGLNVVRREGIDAPAFVDTRGPLTGELPAGSSASESQLSRPATNATTEQRVASVTTLTARPAPCAPPQIGSEPLDGGRMLIRLDSVCRASQSIRLSYGGAMLQHSLDPAGRLETTLDLFAGTASPVGIVFEDGTSREIPARANDLDRVEKVALIWRSPVDLDLHVFEYGAAFGQAGHVWAQSPSSSMSAREQATASSRARGFLSRSDSGRGEGDKVEVYTLFRHPDQISGTVSIAVDFASRGDTASGLTCGTGAQAQIGFETIVVARGRIEREAGVLAAVPCGAAISPEARYGIVHQIRVNR